MISNSIIVIPFNLPWEWTTDYYNQTAITLANSGNTVICFLWQDALSLNEHFQKKIYPTVLSVYRQNIYIYRPIHILPFRRFKRISELNLVINVLIVKFLISFLNRRRHKRQFLWIFDPGFYPLLRFFGNDYYSIYDCVDYYQGSSFNKNTLSTIKKFERSMLLKCNKVFVITNQLYKIHSNIRSQIKIVPQGFRIEQFVLCRSKSPNHGKGNIIIGYIGGINDRLDYVLLLNLVKQMPKIQFTFCGQKQFLSSQFNYYEKNYLLKLFNFPNVQYLKNIDKTEIPNILSTFSIGIIPYNKNQSFNKYCFPMKLFEYFYMGIPVISTPIEELRRFPTYVKISSTAAEWEHNIIELLSKPWPISYKREQRKLAIANSWEQKIKVISKYID